MPGGRFLQWLEMEKDMTKEAQQSNVVQLPQIRKHKLSTTLVGDSPLIIHRFTEKARRQMLDKQMGKAQSTKKQPKDPWDDFVQSMYWISKQPKKKVTDADIKKARFGFPSVGLKTACVTACTSISGMTKIGARQAFHVENEFFEILGTPPVMREDLVRIQKTTDVRHRGQFNKWYAYVDIIYNSSAITSEQVLDILNVAGFGVGLGEWRPDKNGTYGRFHIATEADIEAINTGKFVSEAA